MVEVPKVSLFHNIFSTYAKCNGVCWNPNSKGTPLQIKKQCNHLLYIYNYLRHTFPTHFQYTVKSWKSIQQTCQNKNTWGNGMMSLSKLLSIKILLYFFFVMIVIWCMYYLFYFMSTVFHIITTASIALIFNIHKCSLFFLDKCSLFFIDMFIFFICHSVLHFNYLLLLNLIHPQTRIVSI